MLKSLPFETAPADRRCRLADAMPTGDADVDARNRKRHDHSHSFPLLAKILTISPLASKMSLHAWRRIKTVGSPARKPRASPRHRRLILPCSQMTRSEANRNHKEPNANVQTVDKSDISKRTKSTVPPAPCAKSPMARNPPLWHRP